MKCASPAPAFPGLCCLLLLVLFGAGCASTRTTIHEPETAIRREVGIASYYAHKYHGKRTASGERYHRNQMTAAHRRLPFGSKVKVTNLHNNRSVIVRINDRGPNVRSRIIDVSLAAARELEMIRSGLARVQVDYVSRE